MSTKTWKEEFYPICAHTAAGGTAEQIVEHSLQKWRGLLPVNLARHGLKAPKAQGSAFPWATIVFGIGEMPINNTTCSLCVAYENEDADTDADACIRCPLAQCTGKSCNYINVRPLTPEEEQTPAAWQVWIETRNPEPMVAALEATLAFVKANPGKFKPPTHG